MAPAEKESLDGAAVITGRLGRDQILQCLVVRLRNVRSEMFDSRLWSKTGSELTHRQLRAFFGRCPSTRKQRGAQAQGI